MASPQVSAVRSTRIFLCVLTAAFLAGAPASAQDAENDRKAPKGLRIFSCGHSFHVFMPNILKDMAQLAGVKDHVQVGLSSIGGSRTIQHWNVPDDKFKSKETLQNAKADVLTLSPIFLPDEGIENFVRLGVKHNPKLRVLIQEFWMPFDHDSKDFPPKERPKTVERNGKTSAQLHKMHAAYFASMDGHVRDLNEKYGKDSVFVVPVGQAVIALRERIIDGKAPGIKSQDELFTDAIGHVRQPVQALVAYCHYSVIYRQSPVGLPIPNVLKQAKIQDAKGLNLLLQELAWDAARRHPLSGVKGE